MNRPDPEPGTRASPSVRLRLLGPLEVTRGSDVLPLGGPRRRAALGCLLLHSNQVVPASRLITALWGDSAPPSARKSVQNAVWRLRTALAEGPEGPEGPGPRLLTRAPGYMLRAEPYEVDLLRFQELAARGRARSADGLLSAASGLWREALALWRGPALSDLVEAGVSWPELRALEEARLDVLEDCFDAELRLGHHHRVLPGIQRTVRGARHRERLLAHLLTALYRCGRQSEALAAYEEFVAFLDRELGLEPGREVRELYRAVLSHDPGLLRPSHESVVLDGGSVRRPLLPPVSASGPEREHPVLRTVPPARPAEVRGEVTVVLLRATARRPGPGGGGSDGADGWDGWDGSGGESAPDEVGRRVRAEAGRFGGGVAARVGAFWLLVFADTGPHDRDHAWRAVSAALSLRHHFSGDHWDAPPVAVGVAVATGEVAIDCPARAGAPLSVTGRAVDEAQELVLRAGDREVWVTEETRRRTAERLEFRPAGREPRVWAARGARARPAPVGAVVTPGVPERQTESLRELLAEGGDEPPGRLVLVTGEAGLGKSRLLSEVERAPWRRGRPPLVVRAPVAAVDGGTLRLLAAGLRACCGIAEGDSDAVAFGRLVGTVRRAGPGGLDDPDRILSRLGPLVGGAGPEGGLFAPAEILAAWWPLVMSVRSPGRRVLVLVDDLDLAEDAVLDLVERCAGEGGSPVVVAAARPGLLDRRPGWRLPGVCRVFALRPWDAATVARYVAERSGGHPLTGRFARLLAEVADGNPRVVEAYTELVTAGGARRRGTAGGVVLPAGLRHRARVGPAALPGVLRRTAETVAVIGEAAWPGAVAAACGLDEAEATGLLEELVGRRVLVRAGGGEAFGHRYGFRDTLECQVARTGWPARDRAVAHTLVVEWLRRVDGEPEVSGHLRDRALLLETATGLGAGELARRALSSRGMAGPLPEARDGGCATEYLALAETPPVPLVRLDRVVRAWGRSADAHADASEDADRDEAGFGT
ncbi:BTAD domain-containing putative transcriptional regulator [Streptomyces sp. NPDC001889]